MTVEWQTFWPNPEVSTKEVQFTGFGRGGNGWVILAELHDLDVMATRDGDDILLRAGARDEARTEPSFWLVQEFDDPRKVYPIRPEVHDAKRLDHPPLVTT